MKAAEEIGFAAMAKRTGGFRCIDSHPADGIDYRNGFLIGRVVVHA
jgi:hypothetical protein